MLSTPSNARSGIVTVKEFQFMDVVNGMCVLSLIITGTQPAVEVEDRKKTIFLCEGVLDSSRLEAFSRWRSIDVIGVGLASDYIRALSRTHPQ